MALPSAARRSSELKHSRQGMDERLRALAAWLPRLQEPGFHIGEWAGGEKLADGSMTMPYFDFSTEGLELLRALPVEVFDWGAWLQTPEGDRLRTGQAAVAEATPDQLIKLTTALVRGDRFSEGTLAWAFESGLLAAIARRAAVLTEGSA